MFQNKQVSMELLMMYTRFYHDYAVKPYFQDFWCTLYKTSYPKDFELYKHKIAYL